MIAPLPPQVDEAVDRVGDELERRFRLRTIPGDLVAEALAMQAIACAFGDPDCPASIRESIAALVEDAGREYAGGYALLRQLTDEHVRVAREAR